MKRFLLSCIILSALTIFSWAQTTSNATWGDQGNGTYINPILNSDYSDPDVIRVGDKYYMVASDFHFIGMQVLESEDLVNWKLISKVYDRFDFPEWEKNQRYAGGSWAPSIRYHDGKFWVFFCTPDEGLFMTTATDPEGPWEPLHLVKAVEKWEDPCPLWDDDGQAYLGRSRHGAGPIIIHKMSPDGKQLLDDGLTVYTGPVAEGTKMHKWNGYYYISIPEGGVGEGWQTILRSKNIYGPYEKKVVLEQGTTPINGPHQGAIVDLPDNRWAFIHFQHDGALGRVTHLQPMHWENGWPVIGVDIDRNGIGEPVYSWKKPIESDRIYLPQTDDDFSDADLGLQWQFNHNPVNEAWSLTEKPGNLTLNALKAEGFWFARNTVTQKIMGYVSEATVAMDFDRMVDGQRSGLACMSKISCLLGVRQEDGKRILYWATDSEERDIAELEQSRIYLRVNIDISGSTFQYSYSLNNIDFTPCGDKFFIPFGHWKGCRIGMYTYNKLQDAGSASFDWFKYTTDGPQTTPSSESEKIVASIKTTEFPDYTVSIAAPSKGSSRSSIQKAIDACSEKGGGKVTVAPGVYDIDGNIVMKSNVNLHLQEGAVLMFSGVADDFLPEVLTRWEGTELYGHSPMIYAYHADNIAITGNGVINAQVGKEFAAWAADEAPDRDRLRDMGERVVPLHQRVFGKGTILRPSCIQFMGCSRILVEGVTIKDSPF